MDIKNEMAKTFADFVKDNKAYCGKTQKEIFDKLKKKYPAQDKDTLNTWSADIHKVCEAFAGKGPVEIEEDLNDMSTIEVDDFLIIAKRLMDP